MIAKVEEIDTIGRVGDLNELLIEGFDAEQVWAELELQNQPLYHHLSDLTDALLEDPDEVDLDVGSEDGSDDDGGMEIDDSEEIEEGSHSDSEGESGTESDGSMDSDEARAAKAARKMRARIRGEEVSSDEEIVEDSDEEDEDSEESPISGTSKKKKSNPLDDQFFNFDEMAAFADVGETGGGLLTNTGDSDEDEIYNLMYGAGDDEEDENGEEGIIGGKKKSKKSSKKRGRGEEENEEDADLDRALDQARRKFGLGEGDEKDDEEEDGGLFGSEGSDVDAEDAYYEDFFAEPPPAKGKTKSRLVDGFGDGEEEASSEKEEEDSYDVDDGEESDEEMPRLQKMSKSGREESMSEESSSIDEEDLAKMSSHQRDQYEREKQMRKMEREILRENERDETAFVSTGDLGVSAYEHQQRNLLKRTSQLEDELVKKRRWTMGGEVKASQRGTNTLLAEDLDFELATKQAPIMTAEVTKSLEERIKRRILDQVFDDPVRKLERAERGDFRERAPHLDQEKSSKSLAQIYEDDYMQTTMGVKDEEKLSDAHRSCIALFKSICFKLDALSNTNYTPVKVRDEIDVVPLKEAAAIRMEEITPITTSAATLLAPEELYKSETKGVARGESEWSTEEKRAARREKKRQNAKAEAEKKSEKKRLDTLHPERAKRGPSVAEALQQIAKGPNTTISKNSDRTNYNSTTVFQKITDASTKDASSFAQKQKHTQKRTE